MDKNIFDKKTAIWLEIYFPEEPKGELNETNTYWLKSQYELLKDCKSLATAAQYKAWENQYGKGNVIELIQKTESGEMVCGYVYSPKKHTQQRILYAKAQVLTIDKKPLEVGALVLTNCWLDGDSRLKDGKSFEFESAANELSNRFDFLPTTSRVR